MACCHHAADQGCRVFSRLPNGFILFLLCRIGEAKNPGPSDDFVIGAFNPSGLHGKAPYIVSHLSHGDIWAVSETHLSSQTLQAFRAGMHFAQGKYKYCIGGHPVPPQDSRRFHNAWRGVAMLSAHPTRAVPTRWPEEITLSSRALVTTTLMQDIWITGGVVYGEPESGMYPMQKEHNEALLHEVIGQVCYLSKGPRFVSGDWNVSQGTLPAFDMLRKAGFVDLQDIAYRQWGIPVQPTCKHATRKDYCYISRELQGLLKSVSLDADIFPDHAVLQGVFAGFHNDIPRNIWVSPQPFPWPKHWDVDPHFWNNLDCSSDLRYQALWQHIEQQAMSHVPYTVPRKCTGRACTYNTRPKQAGKIAPPKKARQNEVQPHYVSATFRHAQWLRQVRRLQSYVRYVKQQPPFTHHAMAIWGAIVRATGFTPGFVDWWQMSTFRTPGSPEQVPLAPPPWNIAEKIFDSFLLAFRSFERELQQASRQYARQRREQNPNLIFQDIRTHKEKGVGILPRISHATITEVRHEDCSIVLDRAVSFTLDRPIYCKGIALEPIHIDHDCLWLASLEGLEVDAPVAQPAHLGTDQELFSLFTTAWEQMWDRHRNVSHDRWDKILGFAREKLPQQTLQWDSLDVSQLNRCILHKKSTTTGGLDGVTLADLKAMPHSALANFVAMFQHAETTGDWPGQLIAGRVTCLAKVEEPQHALDFRPITVIGILYRCWGTHHAKHAIRQLEDVLPTGLFGSRPHCFAGQIWSQLLWTIELAYASAIPLCGLIADLRKAFNFLPRAVVMESCALIGIPFRVLRAWAGALACMPRHFQINGSLSPPVLSNCGLPEGCALSCLGMMVVDILFHFWMVHFFPLCQPMSYVDDWQVLLTNPEALPSVFVCLEQFVQAMDLALDQRKTSTWSIATEGRAILRAHGFTTVASGRNLGAHVQFTRQHTNNTLMDRVHSISPMWPKLRVSAAPYRLKIRALRSAAWPMSLHGIAATTISAASFQALRAGAMKGLRADSAGANAKVQLGLMEGAFVDPEGWAILQTFRLTRDCGTQGRVEGVLAELVAGDTKFPSNTITHTLMRRIHTLGWHVNKGGKIVDCIGGFSLFTVSMPELVFRIDLQWPQVVAAAVSHRPCFQGLGNCDAEDTRQWLKSLDVANQALFRKVLNGSHITQDGKKHCQEANDDQCPFCQCSDSRYHRFWECERFATQRQHLTPQMYAHIVDLPESLTACGWSVAPTTRWEWYELLDQIHVASGPVMEGSGPVHLFTDGSCHLQHCTQFRFAGWAVVQASLHSVHDLSQSSIIDRGHLPGVLQSAARAEVFALLRALQAYQNYQGSVTIWSDCSAVVKRARGLLAGHVVSLSSAHADLWTEVFDLLQSRPGPTYVNKVAAHRTGSELTDVFTEWCFRHNTLADKTAVGINLQRDSAFWMLHARHMHACQTIGALNRLVQNIQLSISQEVVRQTDPIPVVLDPEVLDLPPPEGSWQGLPEFCVPAGALRWYNEHMLRVMLSWFWQSLWDSPHQLVWISHYHLYADFGASTGHHGPIKLNGWQDGSQFPLLSMRGIGYKQRTKWFVKVLKESMRHLKVSLQTAYCKPWSQMVLFHTGCIALPWDRSRISAIDRWMLQCSGVTFKRQSKTLDALPMACRSDDFPKVYISTFGN